MWFFRWLIFCSCLSILGNRQNAGQIFSFIFLPKILPSFFWGASKSDTSPEQEKEAKEEAEGELILTLTPCYTALKVHDCLLGADWFRVIFRVVVELYLVGSCCLVFALARKIAHPPTHQMTTMMTVVSTSKLASQYTAQDFSELLQDSEGYIKFKNYICTAKNTTAASLTSKGALEIQFYDETEKFRKNPSLEQATFISQTYP